MTLVPGQISTPPRTNVPHVDGQHASLRDHAEEIVAGFRQSYEFLSRHRSELSAPDGPLAAFAGIRVRFVFRATQSTAHSSKRAVRRSISATGPIGASRSTSSTGLC